MLCTRCNKRDAKVLYTEIINGSKTEQHLCEECAAQYTSFQMENTILNKDITLGDLFSSLFESVGGLKGTTDKTETRITCDSCGTTYDEFVQKGRFGCAKCYQSFAPLLQKTMKGIQGAEEHTGKRPQGNRLEKESMVHEFSEIERLSQELQEAIKKEEYEEAAKLRDRIKELRKEEANNA